MRTGAPMSLRPTGKGREEHVSLQVHASRPYDQPLSVAPRPASSTNGLVVALIPAYNEARFIGSLVLTVQPYVDEVIVVDDGSRDRTAEIAQKAGATVIRHLVNQGKATAVNTGFNYVRQRQLAAVVMLDGDGQHAADDIPRVLQPVLANDADVVIGSRFKEIKSDIPTYRQLGQHGLTITTNLASGVWVSDSQSGFRAFSSSAVEQLAFSQGGFSIESEMQFLVREHRLRVLEAPISVVYAEPAKRNPYKHAMQVLNGILRLIGQIRPLLFFGMSGVGVFGLGALLGLHVINVYAQTRILAVGYALITVMVCVIGILLLFTGLILHSTRGLIVELRRSLTHSGQEALSEVLGDRPPTADESIENELALEVGQ